MTHTLFLAFVSALCVSACSTHLTDGRALGLHATPTKTPASSSPTVTGEGAIPSVRLRRTATQSADYEQPAPLPFALGQHPTEFGIQINGCDHDPEGYLDDIRTLRFIWIKQQVRWGDMTTPTGTDWSCLDRLVAAANKRRIKLLFSVTTAPAYLRLSRDTLGFPDRVEDFGYFLYALLTRYPKQVHALEIWNEPNIEAESKDGVSALRYQAYLTMGFGIAKFVDPDILVISGAPAPVNVSHSTSVIDDYSFLSKLFEYDGLSRLDCIGAHANGPEPSGSIEGVASRYFEWAEQSRPVCVTELGYALPVNNRTSPDFAWAMQHTEALQLRVLAAGVRWARQTGYVRLVILWNWNYFTDNPSDTNALYALTRPGWHSQALDALQKEFNSAN